MLIFIIKLGGASKITKKNCHDGASLGKNSNLGPSKYEEVPTTTPQY
jgi:hypothetical protein